MDDMINRHDSIAEENIEPNGRPAKNEFEEWSTEVTDRADNVFKGDTKDGPIKDREKRIIVYMISFLTRSRAYRCRP